MSGNKNQNNQDILILYLALVVSIALTLAYFLFDFIMKNPSVKGFFQSISGNIIATTLSFVIIYIFLTKNNISLGASENPRQRSINGIETERFKSELFSRIDRLRDQIGDEVNTKLDLTNNSPLSMKFELLKSELILQIQQMSKQIGKEVSTTLDFDSNKLYQFYGLADVTMGVVFQNFRVSRNSDNDNVNPVSFLWADTLYGNTINASVIDEIDPFLRVDFQSFERSWGCNIAIRPQEEKAVEIKSQGGLNLNYLYLQARISSEALQGKDMLHDVGIAVRLVNGKYQQWDYGSGAKEYIQFQLHNDGNWTPICVDLQDKKKWHHFNSDGNPYISEEDRNNADLSIISAVIIKFGKFLGIRGELGYGKAKVDIRDIRFSPTQIRM